MKQLTYNQILEKLQKVELALWTLKKQKLQEKQESKVKRLTVLKESYMNKIQKLKEQETGTVMTDKPEEAEKLAKKGINVKLTKEQENQQPSVNISEEFTETVLRVLKDVLRDLGEEISKSGISNHKDTSFNVNIEFLSDSYKGYNFEVKDGGLFLDDVFLCDVNILPSGDVKVIGDVLRDSLIDRLKEGLNFQDPEEEEEATDSLGNVLEIGDKVKVRNIILEVCFDPNKNLVYLKTEQGKQIEGGTSKFRTLLENSEKLPVDVDDIDLSWLDAELEKQADDWEEKKSGRYTKNTDDEEQGIVAERLEGPLEIVVQMDSSRKATQIYKDGAYRSRYGIQQTYADTFTTSGISLENDLEGMEILLADFQKHGVGIKSESISSVFTETLKESKQVEVGDKVKISKEYGGARGTVKAKRGSWIVLDNGESYHESDVVSVKRDFNEDFHIGHQDDEPGMLSQTVFEIANYAADIHKMLKFYEGMEQSVNFPNWWQAKVILARDYISKAAHWLEYETRELDQNQTYLSERRKCKYNK